jgi:hypothetical protein
MSATAPAVAVMPSPARKAGVKGPKGKALELTAPQASLAATLDQASLPALAEALQYQEIEKLQDYGINAADIKKLKEAGVNTALAVIYTTRKDLVNIKGLSDQKVDKILEAARKLTDAGFVSGQQYLLGKHASRIRISTGSSNVDTLLGE